MYMRELHYRFIYMCVVEKCTSAIRMYVCVCAGDKVGCLLDKCGVHCTSAIRKYVCAGDKCDACVLVKCVHTCV
jgi:hypothetical protein